MNVPFPLALDRILFLRAFGNNIWYKLSTLEVLNNRFRDRRADITRNDCLISAQFHHIAAFHSYPIAEQHTNNLNPPPIPPPPRPSLKHISPPLPPIKHTPRTQKRAKRSNYTAMIPDEISSFASERAREEQSGR